MRQDKLILTQTAGVTKQLGSVVIFNTVFLLRCLNVSSLFTFAEFQKSRLGEVCRALGMFIFFCLDGGSGPGPPLSWWRFQRNKGLSDHMQRTKCVNACSCVS